MSTAKTFLSRILITLSFTSPAMAGMGDLDPRFGDQGLLTLTGNSGPSVVELQDGRLLVVGVTPNGNSERKIILHRLLGTGAPDPTFGGSQGLTVALPVQEVSFVSEAILQPDGKTAIAGGIWRPGQAPFVARLDAGGAIDAGFGSAGVWVGGGTEPFYSSLLLTSDGQLLASISDWTSDRIDWFASDGRYLGNLSEVIAPHRMAVQGDGRLVVSGYHRTLKKLVLMRLNHDGSVDSSFGQDGFAQVGADLTDFMSIEPGGDRILLCGPGIQRLTADGRPDITFGGAGTGMVNLGTAGMPAFDDCHGVLALQGGGVVYLGIREGVVAGDPDLPVVGGLTSLGLVDKRFGAGSGASAIPLTPMQVFRGGWFDLDLRLIRLRSGDALLTWRKGVDVELARIDLGGEASLPVQVVPVLKRIGSVEPASVPGAPASSVPPVAAAVPAMPSAGAAGGGSLGAIDLAWLAVAVLIVIRTRVRRHQA